MKRKILLFLVSAAGAFAAATAIGQSSPVKSGAISDDVVKVGVLTDMAGPNSDLAGPGSVEAARMAIADFGGKVLGKPIELVYADHQNKPDLGAETVRMWIDTQRVDMIADVNNSAIALAVAKIANEKKRIFMAGGAATVRLTNEDCGPYVVHYVYDTYALANGTARATVANGGKTWFFVTVDYAFGQALEQDAANAVRAAGGTVLGQVRHPLNAPDFASYMLQAKASKAQVIGLADSGIDAINAIKSANEFGVTKDQALAGLLVFSTDINSLGLAATQGMLLTDGWYWDYDEDTRKLGRRFFEKMKKMPTLTQAGVYSSVLSYLKAVNAAGTDDADKVMAELKRLKINDGFAKNAYIREDGRMMHDMYLMQVKKPSESKYPWDYYIVKAVIPAEQAFQPLSLSRCPMVKK